MLRKKKPDQADDDTAAKKPGFFGRLRARLNKGDSWLTTDVADHLKEYATFKAMGYPHRFFVSIILDVFEAPPPNEPPVFQWEPVTEITLGESIKGLKNSNS